MDAGLIAITLGLSSALVWGVSDFSGGLATRRANAIGVVLASQWAALPFLLIALLLTREPLLPPGDILWGVLAGVISGTGLSAFYAAMARGRMSIVAPLTAVLTAGLPVLFGIISEGFPGLLSVAAFGVALLGIGLVSRPEDGARGAIAGLGLAVFAGVTFGLFLIVVDQIESGAVFWPLVYARITSTVLLLSYGLWRYRNMSWLPGRADLPVVALTGILDLSGTVTFMLAARAGRLDIAAILASQYPAVTVILASLLLKERITRYQLMGVVALLVSILLIAL